jgi:mannose-6-phosphate isomerase-like protein (cupin superfamily)
LRDCGMRKVELNPDNWIQAPGYRKCVLLSDQELASEGSLVQVVVIPPKSAIGDHYHETSREFYYVMAGESTLVINGRRARLRPGDMLLTEPGDVHSLQNEGSQEFKLLVFKTNAEQEDVFWLDT